MRNIFIKIIFSLVLINSQLLENEEPEHIINEKNKPKTKKEDNDVFVKQDKDDGDNDNENKNVEGQKIR